MISNFQLLEKVNSACHSLNDHERRLLYTEDPNPNDDSEDHPGITVRMTVMGESLHMHVRRILEWSAVSLTVNGSVEAVIKTGDDFDADLNSAVQRTIRKYIHRTVPHG